MHGDTNGTQLRQSVHGPIGEQHHQFVQRKNRSWTSHLVSLHRRYFLFWTSDEESLDNFIEHAQKFSEDKKMRSVIKFEVNKSTTTENFLDVAVSLKDQKLQSNLYSKPTNVFLYLNKTSNHPRHVTNNIPKGQFIRVRRICSEKADYYGIFLATYRTAFSLHFLERSVCLKLKSHTFFFL